MNIRSAKHILLIIITAIIGVVLLYISRFWVFTLWARDSVIGQWLHPAGGYLARWIRQWIGSEWVAFELIVWVVVLFLTLTVMQKIYERLF